MKVTISIGRCFLTDPRFLHKWMIHTRLSSFQAVGRGVNAFLSNDFSVSDTSCAFCRGASLSLPVFGVVKRALKPKKPIQASFVEVRALGADHNTSHATCQSSLLHLENLKTTMWPSALCGKEMIVLHSFLRQAGRKLHSYLQVRSAVFVQVAASGDRRIHGTEGHGAALHPHLLGRGYSIFPMCCTDVSTLNAMTVSTAERSGDEWDCRTSWRWWCLENA